MLGAVPVTGLADDSRKAGPGFVFFAVPGAKADGTAFIADALSRGAAAIVAERQPAEPIGPSPFILVDDARHALAKAAAIFYSRQPATIVAVTGTSGKTSIASFCQQIWTKTGHQAASLGTLGIVAPQGAVYGSLTTPGPIALHESLDGLAASGVTHLAIEASSHGLEQKRLDGVRLSAGAFTNLSRDHLDYHLTFEAYLDAKLRLFTTLLVPGQTAVINADSGVAGQVYAAAKARGLDIWSVGHTGRTLRLTASVASGAGTALSVEASGRAYDIKLPLAGDFQVSNALVAAGLCLATGSAPDAVFAALETIEGAPGRLQLAGRRGTASVFVDYAHKPDALDKVLTALRPLTTGRLVVVFGCGGDRDQGKRPVMGEIAARLADRVIVTDDNPRSEQPAAIRAAILAGAARGPAGTVETGDRASAIEAAVASLQPGDVLVIAGKGHETGQIIGDRVLPFSDLDCARLALQNHPA